MIKNIVYLKLRKMYGLLYTNKNISLRRVIII